MIRSITLISLQIIALIQIAYSQGIIQSKKNMKTFYTSETARQEILQLYDKKLQELNIEHESLFVETSFGKTHILVTGNTNNPPLILVHGSNGCAPIALETYPNLSKKYRVYAVDVLAQPNKSAETRLSMKDLSYGKWMHEIIAQLQLKEVTMAGFSFGGLIILKTIELNEAPIQQVLLAAPVYIVNGNPLKALFKVFIPMKRFMKTEKLPYLEKFLNNLFSTRDEFAVNYLSKVLVHFDLDFTPLPVISKDAAQQIKTPIYLIAAEQDILFPGKKMKKRAEKIFPSLKKVVLLKNSKHVQNRTDNKLIESLLLE